MITDSTEQHDESNVTNHSNSSILENPQFCKEEVLAFSCYGYCDKFCDWWI